METMYETYVNSVCNDIPPDNLRSLITGFLYDAAKDMGCDFDKIETPERVYYIISTHYHHLPLMMVASAFKRGALGQYGAGRLIPRTIYGWLGEINQVFLTKHNTRDNTGDDKDKYKDLLRFPLGKAICKKIDWYKKGSLKMRDWDKVPLKQLAEMIGKNEHPRLEDFGISDHYA